MLTVHIGGKFGAPYSGDYYFWGCEEISDGRYKAQFSYNCNTTNQSYAVSFCILIMLDMVIRFDNLKVWHRKKDGVLSPWIDKMSDESVFVDGIKIKAVKADLLSFEYID
jgi:hypothetical protein